MTDRTDRQDLIAARLAPGPRLSEDASELAEALRELLAEIEELEPGDRLELLCQLQQQTAGAIARAARQL